MRNKKKILNLGNKIFKLKNYILNKDNSYIKETKHTSKPYPS